MRIDKEEGSYHQFNFDVAEDKFIEYQQRFEEKKKIEDPNTRKTELEKLFEEYSGDWDIKELARIYAMGCSREGVEDGVYEKYPGYSEGDKSKEVGKILKESIEKVKSVVDLRTCILGEIKNYEIGEGKDSKEAILEIVDDMEIDPFMPALEDAYQVAYGTLTTRDLRKQFTI